MTKSHNIPERMCVACRAMKPKTSLVRLVRENNELIIDESGKKQARGLYVCKCATCISRLTNAKFARKSGINVSEQLLKQLEGQIVQD